MECDDAPTSGANTPMVALALTASQSSGTGSCSRERSFARKSNKATWPSKRIPAPDTAALRGPRMPVLRMPGREVVGAIEHHVGREHERIQPLPADALLERDDANVGTDRGEGRRSGRRLRLSPRNQGRLITGRCRLVFDLFSLWSTVRSHRTVNYVMRPITIGGRAVAEPAEPKTASADDEASGEARRPNRIMRLFAETFNSRCRLQRRRWRSSIGLVDARPADS